MPTLTANNGLIVITPELVLGWDSARAGRNVIHSVLDRAEPNVTLRPADLKAGTLALFFTTYDAAADCEDKHTIPLVWHFDMGLDGPYGDYVVDGDIQLASEGDDHRRWVVRVGFHEVLL
jgi:hypothetical protein